MPSTFNQSQAYKNGAWLRLEELSWSVTDLGTTQGAILVERLRTLGSKLYAVDDHEIRLADGADKLGIPWPPSEVTLSGLCQELIDRNKALVEQAGDVGLVFLLSPGNPGIDRYHLHVPTVMAHLSPLPFAQLSRWYAYGAALHLSRTRNVPAECWSPSIKTRSRLQYYLADRGIADHGDSKSKLEIPKKSQSPRPADSVAVLLSMRGHVTETSISNLLLLGKDGVLRSPPLQDILSGTSLKTVCELSKAIGQSMEFTELGPSDLFDATEILLTGSTGCLWSAVSVDGYPIGDGRPGPVCRRLQDAWQNEIDFNFIEQAIQRHA